MSNKDHRSNIVGPVQNQELFSHDLRWVLACPLVTLPLSLAAGYLAKGYHADGLQATIGWLAIFNFATLLVAARLARGKIRTDKMKAAYQVAMDAGQEAYFVLRCVNDITGESISFALEDCNDGATKLLGKTKIEILATRLSDLFPATAYRLLFQDLYEHTTHAVLDGDVEVPSDWAIAATWIHRRVVRCGDHLAVTLRDISSQKAHEAALETLTNSNSLTGLPNRHWLLDRLPGTLSSADRSRASIALIHVDLDNFKHINSSLGHADGDRLLRAAAMRLRKVTRGADQVVHLGADEFAIVVESSPSRTDVNTLIARIAGSFSEPLFLTDQTGHQIRASLGISFYPEDASSAEALIQNSGIAMHAAKAGGKGQHVFYNTDLARRMKYRSIAENNLRRAIELDEFVLYYQPRVNAVTGEIVSMEALVRWIDDNNRVTLPEEFIPLAEETGLIRQLGELVIQKACAQISQWQIAGLPVVPVSVNVSAPQLTRGSIAHFIRDTLAGNAVNPNLLEVEITESCMVSGAELAHGQISRLEEFGIKLLIDDFGTGYSSLSQLQRLDMDVLKIDRAFTKQLGTTPQADVLFQSIVSMAHALGMTAVAEGVETADQAAILRRFQCDEVQGYYVSKPVPAIEIPQLLQKKFLYPACNDEHAGLLIA